MKIARFTMMVALLIAAALWFPACGGGGGSSGTPAELPSDAGGVEPYAITPTEAATMTADVTSKALFSIMGYEDIDVTKAVSPADVSCEPAIDATVSCVDGDPAGGSIHATGTCLMQSAAHCTLMIDLRLSFEVCSFAPGLAADGDIIASFIVAARDCDFSQVDSLITVDSATFTLTGETVIGLRSERLSSLLDAILGIDTSVERASLIVDGEAMFCKADETGVLICDPSVEAVTFCVTPFLEQFVLTMPECSTPDGINALDSSCAAYFDAIPYCVRGCCRSALAYTHNVCTGNKECSQDIDCDPLLINVYDAGELQPPVAVPVICADQVCQPPCLTDADCDNNAYCDFEHTPHMWAIRYGLSPDYGVCRCVTFDFVTGCLEIAEGIHGECDENGMTIDGFDCMDVGLECRDGCCLSPLTDFEVCDDGINNDADAYIDCEDPDCWLPHAIGGICPEVCTGCNDEDGDGAWTIDCGDPDCIGDPACEDAVPEVCDNGIDDDLDCFTDCYDADCWEFPGCGRE